MPPDSSPPVPAAPPGRPPARSVRRGPAWFLEAFGPLIALLVLCTIVAALSPDFRRPENARNIIHQMSFVGIVAVGMTYVIILGGIDLSVGSMVALLGGCGLMLLKYLAGAEASAPMSIGAAVAVMVLGGLVLGVVNGTVIAIGRIAPFVATLGTMVIFRSVVLWIADGGEIPGRLPRFAKVAAPWFNLPILKTSRGGVMEVYGAIIVFAFVAVAAQIILRKTTLGLNIKAIGDNPTAARYAGIKVRAVTIITYAIAGLTCGIAAVMNSSRLNSVSSSTAGFMYELDAIAAVVIGGTRMRGGAGSVVGTVIGVLILGVISNMLNMLDVSTHLQGLVKGGIIIAAVLLQRFRRDG
jgi:ribose transport system permease protein